MILKKLKAIKKQIISRFDPLERDFEKIYPQISTVPGFLKSPHQERWFFTTAKRAPQDAVIVEIGSFKGRSTVSFGYGCIGTEKHVYAIDLFEGDSQFYGSGDFQEMFSENIKKCQLEKYVTAVKGDSRLISKKWNMPIDILFIDGSHEYEDVKADFYSFYPFVKKGGWIALHDIKGMWPGVTRFWKEIQMQNFWQAEPTCWI